MSAAWVVTAYAVPATITWLVVGLVLGVLPVAGIALAAAVAYGCYYGVVEVSGRRGLPPPGRRWQVPQTMLIDASPRRRVLVWGAILGPGFLTRNPYGGFGALLLVVAAMGGPLAGLTAGAAIGAAHGAARAAALLRDVRELRSLPAGPAASTHLDLLLSTVRWRRWDGAALLALAVIASVAAVGHFG
ncbi:MAG TPA: hypothetical protein VLX31_10010 [Streptosporangiaceae bacterium]|nr:hypothetical protein [Streptosporangiaceae bacterium]